MPENKLIKAQNIKVPVTFDGFVGNLRRSPHRVICNCVLVTTLHSWHQVSRKRTRVGLPQGGTGIEPRHGHLFVRENNLSKKFILLRIGIFEIYNSII